MFKLAEQLKTKISEIKGLCKHLIDKNKEDDFVKLDSDIMEVRGNLVEKETEKIVETTRFMAWTSWKLRLEGGRFSVSNGRKRNQFACEHLKYDYCCCLQLFLI